MQEWINERTEYISKKNKSEITVRSSAAEYLTYVASTGDNPQNIEIRYEDENIWLTQKVMVKLYEVTVPTVNYHINKIFKDSELQKDSVIRKFLITADDGKTYNTNHYSLERKFCFLDKRNKRISEYAIKNGL